LIMVVLLAQEEHDIIFFSPEEVDSRP
jgi:hypothetical protein